MENERGVSGMTPGGGQRAAAGTSRSPFRVGEDRPPLREPRARGPHVRPWGAAARRRDARRADVGFRPRSAARRPAPLWPQSPLL